MSWFDRESWPFVSVNWEPLEIIVAIDKYVDLRSEQLYGISPAQFPSPGSYQLRGLPEPNMCSLYWRTFHGFSSIVLSHYCLNPWTFQETTRSCERDFTAELCVVWRAISFCFHPPIYYLYLMPAPSCHRRDSKCIIPYSLCLCHSWIYTALSNSTLSSLLL